MILPKKEEKEEEKESRKREEKGEEIFTKEKEIIAGNELFQRIEENCDTCCSKRQLNYKHLIGKKT